MPCTNHPRLLYGTAWKEDETQRLTELALRQGFRGIDTANQRRHYHEAAVGQAIAARSRAAWWPGTTCSCRPSSPSGGARITACPTTPTPRSRIQVEQSFASSLEHLGVAVIDSYLLHGPTQRVGLAAADWEAWRAMEAIHDSGRARLLGVSNVTPRTARRAVPAGARPAPLRPEPLLRRPGLGP